MRIGAFSFDSQNALLTENLIPPLKILKEKTLEKMIELNGCCVVRNIKSGIWIAGNIRDCVKEFLISMNFKSFCFLVLPDLQLVRCPVCDLNTCDGKLAVFFHNLERNDKGSVHSLLGQ